MGPRYGSEPVTPDMLTLDEVAKHLKCSKKTVTRAIQNGDLKAFKMSNRWFVETKDLRDYVGANKFVFDQTLPQRTAGALRDHNDIVETNCMLTCGLHPEEMVGGTGMFFLETWLMSHACPHFERTTGLSLPELQNTQWMQVTKQEIIDAVEEIRQRRTRYLSMNVPIRCADDSVGVFDIVNDPVVDIDGEITGRMFVMIAAPSGWRNFSRIETVVDFAGHTFDD